MRYACRVVWAGAIAAAVVAVWVRPAYADGRHIAVFNFQMKSAAPHWVWLEKGLSDVITTNLVRNGLSVVARDEMQMLASELNWLPDMCRDEKITQQIRARLRIDLLVSGTYRIEGERIEIVAQVIEIGSRKELCRRSVTAPTAEVLALPQKLSAELLAWFRGQPVEDALPTMALWTRSIPAAQALYEGMHLFDQGLYSQAWLKFRQASRSDPAYLDAIYWVARMYYFMDQYEHARLAYDKFVYLDSTHPRLGDAIKEYLHTLEKTDTPGERLLAIYGELIRRYPDVKVYNEMEQTAGVSNKRFLEVRSGQLLGQMERPAEGAQLAANKQGGLNGWECRVAMNNVMTHHMLTGDVVMPDALARQHQYALRFTPENPEAAEQGMGNSQYVWFFALAPSGYTFKSLHLMPEIQGGEKMILGVGMHKDSYADIPQSDHTQHFRDAAARGFLFNQMPRTGIVQFHYYYSGGQPDWSINRLRVKAELEKVPQQHGAIWVDCNNTHDFNVYVDGRFGRSGCGLIGLLTPGRHELEFHLGRKAIAAEETKQSLLAPTKTTCEVAVGKVAKLVATMSWKQGSLWSDWHAGAFADRSYPGYDTDVNYRWGRPSVQMDDRAIRIVWSRMGDLWWTASLDGMNFTPPQRLLMPISTSWSEERPTLLRDETGRFILAFISDRNGQRTKRLYVCWSRDMLHWSAPAMVEDRVITIYDLMQDKRGRFLCADATQKEIVIEVSSDLFRWERVAVVPLPDWGRGIKIQQRNDGVYELVATHKGDRPMKSQHQPNTCDHVVLATSTDLVDWSPLKEIATLLSDQVSSLGLMRVGDRSVVGYFEECNRPFPEQMLVQVGEADGTWRTSGRVANLFSFDGTMGWHARWGYVITWTNPPGVQFPEPFTGPFVLCGPSLKPFFGKDWNE